MTYEIVLPCEGCGTLIRFISSSATATAQGWADGTMIVWCTSCWEKHET